MYGEIIFLIVWICFFVLFWFFRIYQIVRRRELARYYTIEHLQKIDPYDFECCVIELLNHTGCRLRWVGGSWDEWIDGIGSNTLWKRIILQVKRYSDKNVIDTTKFREFIGTLAYHDVASGVYVTTGFVSSWVREMVRKHTKKEILIIDKDDLMTLIRKIYG